MTEIDAQWMWPAGEAGARVGKKTLVLPGALPGERVKADLPGGKGVVRATSVQIVTPSPHRRTPPCPHTARCGGCDLAHAQPTARVAWLAATHARNLGLADLDVTASPRRDARARIRLTVDDGVVGYRAPQSHELVPIASCGIARPEVQAALARVLALDREDLAGVQTLELRSDGQRVVADVTGHASATLLDTLEHATVNGKTVRGDPTLWLDNGGPPLRASPGVFYQVNLDLNRHMVAWVVEQVAGARVVADLYSGIGNFTLPLAQSGATVHAVEIAQRAVADCAASARRAGLDERIVAVREDADQYEPTERYVDAMVLDPPRRGAGDLMKRIVTARTPRVVLVSCDPRAAVRDTRVLRDAGYRLVAAHGFDLFVDTHHLELATSWSL